MSASTPQEHDTHSPALVAARWLAEVRSLQVPPEVVEAARTCLIDWFACALGGMSEAVTGIVRRRIAQWAPSGSAPLLSGGTSTPSFAAMLHSTAAHTTDFDDTHIWTDAHFSGPTWAAVLAHIGGTPAVSDDLCLRAFLAGFETGAKMGGRRLGHAMVHRGFQATAMLGRLSAAAACSVLKDLSADRIAMALTVAGCQTSGLSIAAGSMMKPYQGGKTAFDGVISTDLAQDDFIADPRLFDSGGGSIGATRIGGLARAFVQDGFAEFAVPDYAAGWEILRNSTKAYPCLHGLGPVIDAARELHPRIGGRKIEKIRAYVGPSIPKIARYDRPQNAHEGRFSVQYVAALGLLDLPFTPAHFEAAVMFSARVDELVRKVEIVTVEGRKMYNAAMDVILEAGEALHADVPLGRGHPGRPLNAAEMEMKFRMLVEPALGLRTAELLDVLRSYPEPGSLRRAFDVVRRAPLHSLSH